MEIKSDDHIKVAAGKGKYLIMAEAQFIGEDIIVSVWGGTKPHIGSVAAAVPRPSLANPVRTSATSSVINLQGHKDDIVSKLFSESIAAHMNRHCVATAGIHIKNATSLELAKILKNCKQLCDRLLKILEKQR